MQNYVLFQKFPPSQPLKSAKTPIFVAQNIINITPMSYFVTNHQSEEQRRDELIHIIEHSVARLTLQELDALSCDMSTKNYINESPIASWE